MGSLVTLEEYGADLTLLIPVQMHRSHHISHAFVTSRLGYCSILYVGLHLKTIGDYGYLFI